MHQDRRFFCKYTNKNNLRAIDLGKINARERNSLTPASNPPPHWPEKSPTSKARQTKRGAADTAEQSRTHIQASPASAKPPATPHTGLQNIFRYAFRAVPITLGPDFGLRPDFRESERTHYQRDSLSGKAYTALEILTANACLVI